MEHMELLCGGHGGRSGRWQLKNTSFKLGNGKRVNFWSDIWYDEIPLERYNELFNLAENEEAIVADVYSIQQPVSSWNSEFSGRSYDLEVSVVIKLYVS